MSEVLGSIPGGDMHFLEEKNLSVAKMVSNVGKKKDTCFVRSACRLIGKVILKTL